MFGKGNIRGRIKKNDDKNTTTSTFKSDEVLIPLYECLHISDQSIE